MPELPEVETIRLELLKAHLVNERFDQTDILWNNTVFCPNVSSLSNALQGRTIKSIERFGKTLLFSLDLGILAIHLRMSGKLLIAPYPPHFAPYLRVRFQIGKRELHLIDPRKFARVQLRDRRLDLRLAKGMDLLALSDICPLQLRKIAKKISQGRRAIKAVLLDQNLIAGIGNIYADEALWQVQLHPLTPQHIPSSELICDLLKAALKIVKQAIEAGGTSLGTSRMNFQSAFGSLGNYQCKLAVYGRYNSPCPRCAAPIARTKIAQRTSHFCPQCQPI